jgi:hypothetical protein
LEIIFILLWLAAMIWLIGGIMVGIVALWRWLFHAHRETVLEEQRRTVAAMKARAEQIAAQTADSVRRYAAHRAEIDKNKNSRKAGV